MLQQICSVGLRRERVFCLGLSLLIVLVIGCSSGTHGITTAPTAPPAPTTPAVSNKWVVSWGASPENALPTDTNAGGSEQTFRLLFSPTVSGTQERLHFSNFFGTTPITIGTARLAIDPNDNAAIDPTHDVAITFSGSSSVTIAPGQNIVSDPVQLTYTFGQKLAVSMYVKGTFPPLTQHVTDVQNNFASAVNAGDTTSDATGSSLTQQTQEWFLLSGMDVFGPYQGTVVVFGSSSIDGNHSDYGDTNLYPTANVPVPGQDSDRPSDWLARQLIAAGYNMGVLNAGVSADPAGPNTGATPATGIADGIDREQRDVLDQPGVTTVVTYLGAVDIKTQDCKSAPDVEDSLTQIISMAAAANVRVIVGTLPPSTFCVVSGMANFGLSPTAANPYAGGATTPGPINPGETQRMLVNTWIRTTAVNFPGVVGIADFDKALADPANPSFLLPNLNSGDNTHPDGFGYSVQSSAIPLNLILPPAAN
jgi:hypothetical protein